MTSDVLHTQSQPKASPLQEVLIFEDRRDSKDIEGFLGDSETKFSVSTLKLLPPNGTYECSLDIDQTTFAHSNDKSFDGTGSKQIFNLPPLLGEPLKNSEASEDKIKHGPENETWLKEYSKNLSSVRRFCGVRPSSHHLFSPSPHIAACVSSTWNCNHGKMYLESAENQMIPADARSVLEMLTAKHHAHG